MKVVILAGGLGTRLSEYTQSIPKPMVMIGNEPIIIHIIKRYIHFGLKDFYIATGYKNELINKYFKKKSLTFKSINKQHSVFELNLINKIFTSFEFEFPLEELTVNDTSLNNMTIKLDQDFQINNFKDLIFLQAYQTSIYYYYSRQYKQSLALMAYLSNNDFKNKSNTYKDLSEFIR